MKLSKLSTYDSIFLTIVGAWTSVRLELWSSKMGLCLILIIFILFLFFIDQIRFILEKPKSLSIAIKKIILITVLMIIFLFLSTTNLLRIGINLKGIDIDILIVVAGLWFAIQFIPEVYKLLRKMINYIKGISMRLGIYISRLFSKKKNKISSGA